MSIISKLNFGTLQLHEKPFLRNGQIEGNQRLHPAPQAAIVLKHSTTSDRAFCLILIITPLLQDGDQASRTVIGNEHRRQT